MHSEQELKKAIENCLPITINNVEYAEPELVSESCEDIPFVTIPTYELTNFEDNSVIYLSFDKGRVAISKKDIPGLKCAVCDLCVQDAKPFYRCNSANMRNQNDYLKRFIQVQELKKEK
jgi:hypothetical protein